MTSDHLAITPFNGGVFRPLRQPTRLPITSSVRGPGEVSACAAVSESFSGAREASTAVKYRNAPGHQGRILPVSSVRVRQVEALELDGSAIADCARVLGHDHPVTQATRQNWAQAKAASEDNEDLGEPRAP